MPTPRYVDKNGVAASTPQRNPGVRTLSRDHDQTGHVGTSGIADKVPAGHAHNILDHEGRPVESFAPTEELTVTRLGTAWERAGDRDRF